MRPALRGLLSSAWPTLRVIGLVYAGLSGVALLVVVISAALTPNSPALQQVPEPAREAVTTIVQPSTERVTGLVAPAAPVPAPAVPPPPAPTAPPFVDITSLDVVIDTPPARQPVLVEQPQPSQRVVYLAPAPEVANDQQPGTDGDQPVDDSVDAAAVSSDDLLVAAPQDAPALQEAAAAPAQQLPTPTPTVLIPTTPAQVKAQVDAANQAAIDAAKLQAARDKAAADAANQAAIDAAKAAKAKH